MKKTESPLLTHRPPQTHRFSDTHAFTKPWDDRALSLMEAAAADTASALGGDCVLAVGASDEFSFLLRPSTTLFGRRDTKLATTAAATFAAAYVRRWPDFFDSTPLTTTPSFDGRAVAYPSPRHARDYVAWRQADAHINTQYNTAFWALVLKGGVGRQAARETLNGTRAAAKNEIMFRHGINYNDLPARHRKGSLLVREASAAGGGGAPPPDPPPRDLGGGWSVLHVDAISDAFWDARPELLGEGS